MNVANQQRKTDYRWVICSMLFFATTINYLDRQVLSLTWKDFIAPEFHWTDSDYGYITGAFSLLYAAFSLFSGKVIDRMGTRRGYLWAIFIWSFGACLHAACGWITMQVEGIESLAALRAIEAGSEAAVAVATLSVWLFIFCRSILAAGESGNFPAAIKVTAEYFPKKDRALATSIFNAGSSIGALVAPLCIPTLAGHLGWESSFIVIGALGFVWMAIWVFVYDKPTHSRHVNAAELAYIQQDSKPLTVQEMSSADEDEVSSGHPVHPVEPESVPFLKCFTFRQTWSFVVGKFMTDGVWWFFLFWAPAYFSDQFHYKTNSGMGQALIFVLYLIVTVLSIFGGYLPKYFVERRGMEPYSGRMRAMLLFTFFPMLALFAQPLASWASSPIDPAWWPAIIIGLAGAGHQAWSANLYSTIGDMFPKGAIGTITGIGTMAGGIASMLINAGSGMLFHYAEEHAATFHFLGFAGKPAGYMIVFCICAVAYLAGWCMMKALVPKYKPIEV